jgi:UPF0042 nucleotide-binding protein
MKLIIVSGLSGSGKSIALHTFEDCGYYCIDNLPITLLPGFVSKIMLEEQKLYGKTAIGIDARNQGEFLITFGETLDFIRSKGIDCKVFYMQAEEATLLKRYSETRRRHPLTDLNLSLTEAIKAEKEILKNILKYADLVIDTSRTQFHQLRELIKSQIEAVDAKQLLLQIQSFGYKHGMPLNADYVFDVRILPNPYWVQELRGLTGKDQKVIDFLLSEDIVQEYFEGMSSFLERWVPFFEKENRCYLTIAIGCTGGQHRSVFLAEKLAKKFQTDGLKAIVHHRELS